MNDAGCTMKQFLSQCGLGYGKTTRLLWLVTVAVVCYLHPVGVFAAPTITYVQGNYASPQTPQTTVNITFTAAQAAGDLNVIVVGWNDSTATVSAVTDSKGNVYTRAVGPTTQSGIASQSIYYAKNIASAAAGANTVSVKFAPAAAYPDIRILEYNGADPNNPVDVTAANSGNSATSSSGSTTTTSATDLIFGANLVQTTTTGPGSGFTRRILTSPDGDIAEDRMVTATGSYSATAPVSPSGRWIMQMVAFRTGPNFAIAASPASLSIVQGNQGTSTITTTISGGFNSAITLSTSGLPTGVTVGFNPNPIPAPGSGTSTMTMTVGASTPVGTYPITVTGNGGGIQQSTTVTLTVTAPPNFTVTASPGSVSVAQGNQGTSTITTAISGGFNSAISLSATGAPTGTSVTFNPATMPAPGAGTSTMTIAVGASTPLGTYPITVTANGGGLQRTATITLTVTSPATFSIAATPTSVSIVQGNQGTSTITTTVSGGFNSAISLSASGAPTGTTVGFNPNPIPAPGSGTSTMTITVGASTPVGTYPITVTGNGGGVQQSTTVTLTITAAPNFTITALPGSVSIAQGNQGTSTITTTVSGGFNSSINLSATGAPAGTTVSFNPSTIPAPGSGTSTMTIAVGSSTPTGTYPLTVTGNGGGIQQTTTVTLTVTQSGITPPTNVTVVDGGPPPIVDAVQSYINSTLLTAHTTAPFDSTGGDLIVMFASSHAGVTMTPSDNFGNTWVTIAGPTNTSVGFDLRSQIWYVANPVVGPGQTVTLTLSAAQSLVMSIFVVKGSNISSPIDAVSLIGSDNGTQTVNVVSPNITTTTASDLLMAWAKVSAGAVFTSGQGFTPQPGASSNFLDAESGTAAAPGAYNGTFTLNTAQTWQSSIVAANNHSNQTTLTWTASTENGGTIAQYFVERCQGALCNSFVQIGNTTTTSYHDDGLTAAMSYSYRVRAQDTNGNLGPYSSVVSITTPLTIPSLPGNLTTTTASTSEIDLSWVASTEINGSIAEYLVERCQGAGCSNFVQIGSTTNTTYNDIGLTAGSTYNYRTRAQDSAGSLSPYSNLASGATLTVGNFTLSASPASLNVTQGTQGTSAITATISGGFNNSINLSAAGMPTGTTVSFNPSSIPAPGAGSSTMTITVGANTPAGTYPITVTGIGGGIQQNATVNLTVTVASASISYVQGNYATPQTPQAAVSVVFPAGQGAGDMNVVVVGWNDSTASVVSVIDSKGNPYTLAVGPTVISGTLSQSIYYARNIASAAAGTNTVTVTFSTAAAYPDIRILEYSGADPNSPVDVTAANSGNSASSSSGSATTTNPNDLIFGANIVVTTTVGPGSGFTSRLLTAPDADIAEDQAVSVTGSYSTTAPLSPAGSWIMQMVAFRANSGSGGPVLTAISVTPVNPLIAVGAHQQFTATGTYSDGSHQDLTGSAAWTSSIPSVATINTSGLATGIAAGSATIQAAVGSINGSTALTVTAGFSISPRATVVTFTQTQQFNATSGFGTVSWSVDGTVGGSPASGTITTNGLYTPPSSTGTHVVTATTNQQQSANATVYVSNYAGTFTYHNDNFRTGQNNSETVLTLANTNQSQFGKLFSYPLDGIPFASPLYVASVNIPGKGFHNVVYVATEHDSVYAFDADGLSNTPLWQVTFLRSGVTTVPCGDTGECGDIPTEIGITGTPVIDQASGTLYVVAKTKENGNYVQRLHALDITSGAEKFAGPVVLAASVTGNGSGSSGGVVPFDPLHENQRPGLLLNNGVVYMAFGSHGDVSPWHGWVLGYNATTLQQVLAYNATPNGSGGGIWQSGGGLATDTAGNIYFTTSNGDFDVNSGGIDYGDTIEKLSPGGTVVDYFTPHDQLNMDVNNLDLGAAGPVLLVDQPSGPYPHLLVNAGKNGTIYVINRDNMGHYNPNNDNQIVQTLVGVLSNFNFSVPVYFGGYVYFGSSKDAVKAFQLTNGLLSASPTSQTPEIYPVRGASFAISSNGGANGMLWAIQNNGVSGDNDTGAPGVLFAYDATNLSNELYNSAQAGSRDTLDYAVKFMVPLVANGKVFVAGQTQLTAFGLLP